MDTALTPLPEAQKRECVQPENMVIKTKGVVATAIVMIILILGIATIASLLLDGAFALKRFIEKPALVRQHAAARVGTLNDCPSSSTIVRREITYAAPPG